jgi:hypothetical protein
MDPKKEKKQIGSNRGIIHRTLSNLTKPLSPQNILTGINRQRTYFGKVSNDIKNKVVEKKQKTESFRGGGGDRGGSRTGGSRAAPSTGVSRAAPSAGVSRATPSTGGYRAPDRSRGDRKRVVVKNYYNNTGGYGGGYGGWGYGGWGYDYPVAYPVEVPVEVPVAQKEEDKENIKREIKRELRDERSISKGVHDANLMFVGGVVAVGTLIYFLTKSK